MLGRLRSLLSRLASRRASHLFLACFLLALPCIWFGILLPWLPAAIVLLYGSVLLAAAGLSRVPHSEMTNNSPYFLGFLLFLFSLLTSFSQLGSATPKQIAAQLGTALVTTIVGLPFRQLLFAYSPVQEDQDIFFRSLEEELRRSATQFKRSQAELVELVTQFLETRELLFSEEEKAARRYIANLQKASDVLGLAVSGEGSAVTRALGDCAKGLAQLKDRVAELSTASQRVSPDIFPQLSSELGRLTLSASDVVRQLHLMRGSVESLTKASDQLPLDAKKLVDGAKERTVAVATDLRTQVARISADLSAIDTILGDFVNLVVKRLAAFR